ncbi:MAG: phosphatase PAP2 family protein [Chloroflexota bacterium]|nr:phosphatase PAP2 family protein [Chloroflexota bacterium]
MVVGSVVAIVTLLTALVATHAAGVPFRDPEHAVGRRLALVGFLVALLAVLDIVVRAGRRSRTLTPSLAAMRRIRRERWSRRRGVAVGSALVSFYVTYLAYRNLKSIVPLLRPGELFDRQLADFDRSLFGGNDPAALLHTLLGTGTAAQVLSAVYYAFFFFVPISLALALVFAPSAQGGIFYAVALSINWPLGAASYYLLPALGPIYAAPADFADLPATETSHLQDVLLRQRIGFVIDPAAADAHQGIAAFASLHTSIIFTAAVAAHMLGLGQRLRIGLWVLFALTAIATIYLGWHYVVDDLAGVVIGLTALALARGLIGFELRTARRLRIPRQAGIAVRPAAAESGQHITGTRALEAPVVDTTSGIDAT